MKKEELDELLKECEDIGTFTHIGLDLILINIDHHINFKLIHDNNFKPYYEIDINDILKDVTFTLEDAYELISHGWKKKDNKLILYI